MEIVTSSMLPLVRCDPLPLLYPPSHYPSLTHTACIVIPRRWTSGDTNHAPPVSGQQIKNTAWAILNGCSDGCGSYGTGNCDGCHVTINYRS